MRIILQRVSQASVVVDEQVIGQINQGLMCLIGFGSGDSERLFEPMLQKLINMRIFENEQGRFDKSLLDIEGELLLVPQFTLYADLKKGRRPDFTGALAPDQAKALFDSFVAFAHRSPFKKVATGQFGANMQVSLINVGPVTITIDSALL
ncbi:MAG: D-tyrosyl-tRNA(Tyr) deacylase [Bdellovibrionales bacterium]|nr:D-tyrosyl-tRNA(Tyr) deacylase [Bdellovibrionales bacterium]